MAQKLDLAFQLTANADGMASGVAKADKELSRVGASSRATAAEFRQAAKITAELRTPTEKYADTIGKLDKMMQKGLLSQEVYGRAVSKADAELQAATSTMDEMANKASIAERVINGLSGAIQGIGDATKSVADAGVSVIKFGKDIAWTYLQWKVFSALRSPAGLKDFAVGALKATMTARTLVLAAKAMGVGLALGGGAAGTAAAAVLGLTNPFVGGALLAYNLGTAFLEAKDRAYELARNVGELNGNLTALKADLGDIRVDQLDNLAFALEEVDAAGKRSSDAFSAFGDVFVTPFVGAFAAINSGLAGLTDGISSIMEGITSILAPIGQVLAPVLTLFGTAIELVLKLIGVLGDVVGIILKVAGAALHTFLSPFIVGLTNVADTIRSGMNAAFDFIGSRIDWASKKIKDFYAYMSKVPIIGRAFAGGDTSGDQGVVAAAGAGQAGANTQESALDAELELYGIRRQNEEAIAEARKKDESERLDAELEAYGDRRAMEQEIEDARKKAASDQLDAELNAYAERRALEQQIEEANRKHQEKVAEKQEEIDKIVAERKAALNGKSNEALQGNDVRSSEGIKTFMALMTGREDPALIENRKANAKLTEMVRELRALQQAPVEILGAAA